MKTIECPHCGKQTVYDESNPYRPFCCERCKLIDLGEWADEGYKIVEPPGSTPSSENDDESEASPLLH